MKFNWFTMVMLAALLSLGACSTSEPANTTDQETNGESEEEGTTDGETSGADSEADATQTDQLSLSAEPDVWENGADLTLILDNSSDEDITLENSSEQLVQFVVKNDAGEEVYDSSADGTFSQATGSTTIAAGSDFRWTPFWDLTSEGSRVPAGTYTLEATIVADTLEEGGLTVTQEFDVAEADESVFRDVSVEGEAGTYTVEGEVNVASGPFSYSIEDGHNVFVENGEFPAVEGSEGWTSFSLPIDISDEELPSNGSVMLVLRNDQGKEQGVRLEQFTQQ
ncbi:BsuPI-related putative proteinase inhibitor [Aureibacillus halotolerans]|uniref:Intracellular proteinase inhibitor BsuPI n=1 Tax=Aureibacillus halotolerans TaxID=1508390 RepID=A0A4R6UB02_9BACI|nr:BsuPI-related putative proteinase inhibitor [Aureibacillus halotolerans]TDQ42099.1 intracellular proteinase inhibitor BsuPI [Aureibacillus halotolerans]